MVPREHTDFEKAFTDGLSFNERGGQRDVLHVQRAGVLDVPSGRLVVCDPLSDARLRTFLRMVPAGRYPVLLSRWKSEALRDERIAAAQVLFSEAPAVRWELALREGDDVQKLRRKSDAAFPVDSGNGCFMDADRARAWTSRNAEAREELVNSARGDTRDVFVLGPASAAEVVGFSTGFGDGWYRSWWGLDAADAPVALVADFHLLAVREWVDLEFPLRGPGPVAHPRLTELDLKCELLEVWESRRIDRSTTVSVRYSASDALRATSAEWRVVDAHGTVIPTQVDELPDDPFGRWGRLRRLQAAEPFPEGARLRLSVRTGTRPL
jgi:hypothetical protein